MDTLGEHYLIEMFNCNSELIKYTDTVRHHLLSAAIRSNATILTDHFYNFQPYGVSGVIIISESHLSIHTWPEYGYAALDYYTCDEKTEPLIAIEYLKEEFEAEHIKVLKVKRGEVDKSNNKIVPHIPYYAMMKV